jgi:probable rRNA maturation factor
MTFYVENESDKKFDFDYEKIATDVVNEALDYIDCPYDTEISLLITNNQEIRQYNLETRNIDKETDVLSFPNVSYEIPGDFQNVEDMFADCFNPESGELILGDIIISADKVFQQATEYGHSEVREFAFLVAHSMFHLFGFDHETEEEAVEMESMQNDVLEKLNILRD